jgi:hypothetical protein
VDPHYYSSFYRDDSSDSKPSEYTIQGDALNTLMATLFDLSFIAKSHGYGGVFAHLHRHRYDKSIDGEILSSDKVVLRPPQSAQQIGQCFVDAYRITGWDRLLDESIRVARALACTQGPSGGWPSVAGLARDCSQGGPVVQSGSVDTDDQNSGAILATATEFISNLMETLRASQRAVPQWLMTMNATANQALNEESFQTGQDTRLDKYIDIGFGSGGLSYDRGDLLTNNPNGLQSTQDLVNQCYAAIRKVASILPTSTVE